MPQEEQLLEVGAAVALSLRPALLPSATSWDTQTVGEGTLGEAIMAYCSADPAMEAKTVELQEGEEAQILGFLRRNLDEEIEGAKEEMTE